MHSRGAILLCLGCACSLAAAFSTPAAPSLGVRARGSAPLQRSAPAAVSMTMPLPDAAALLPPAQLLPAFDHSEIAASSAVQTSTVLIGDAFDIISGFANSPAVLLVPIGAGSLVAGLIIFILVKAAG